MYAALCIEPDPQQGDRRRVFFFSFYKDRCWIGVCYNTTPITAVHESRVQSNESVEQYCGSIFRGLWAARRRTVIWCVRITNGGGGGVRLRPISSNPNLPCDTTGSKSQSVKVFVTFSFESFRRMLENGCVLFGVGLLVFFGRNRYWPCTLQLALFTRHGRGRPRPRDVDAYRTRSLRRRRFGDTRATVSCTRRR